jgi:hypothetical protein
MFLLGTHSQHSQHSTTLHNTTQHMYRYLQSCRPASVCYRTNNARAPCIHLHNTASNPQSPIPYARALMLA